tara:strand:- start:111 stop:854 length:744 start_codon:yes stop_codon:yes gene_type:complete
MELSAMDLMCMGSEYGKWCFVDHQDLYNSVVISGGVGEDISFDVDFASEYNAKIFLYDPTPRAIQHFKTVSENFGSASTIDYVDGGDQPIETYDLSNLTSDNFVYVPYALWNEETTVKFFKPLKDEWVSHSISNINRGYDKKSKEYIEVETIKLSDQIKEMDKFPSLLKLDIEGAVMEVLKDLFENKIFINQLCVEFEELQNPNAVNRSRVGEVERLLKGNNYTCVHADGWNGCNRLYLKNDFLNSI